MSGAARVMPLAALSAALIVAALAARPADAFLLREARPGNRLPMNLNLSATPFATRGYGTESFRSLAETALDRWNQVGVGNPADHAFFSVRTPTITGDPCTGDGVDEVRFATTICGMQWGSIIGVTLLRCAPDCSTAGRVVETDVLFNSTEPLDAYPGPLLQEGGRTLIDFVRLALHEFGHAVGLDHPDQAGQVVFAVMNSFIGDADTLQPDDIAGAHAVNWSGPPGEVALTVVRAGAGAGTGTVTSMPAGIACGTMCTAQYPSGTPVTLSANPAAGSMFAGWSGGGCGGTGDCVVTLTADTMLTATFNPGGPTFTLLQPTIVSPADGTAFPLVAPIPVGFSWTPVAGAGRYFLEFTGPGRDFANPNGTTLDPVNGFGGAGGGFFLPGTSQAIVVDPTVPPGRYRVRVIGAAATGGFVGTFSDAVTVILGQMVAGGQVTVLAPASGAVVARGAAVTVAWTALPGVTQYGLEFTGPNRQFANPNGTGPDPVNGFGGAGGAVLVGGTGLTVVVPAGIAPGTYEVRVIGVSPGGQPLGTFSDAVTLVIE